MSRYIASPARTKVIAPRARVRAYYRDDYEGSVTADEVIDSGEHPDIDTGLVNADGWPIYRSRETVSFGFIPKDRA